MQLLQQSVEILSVCSKSSRPRLEAAQVQPVQAPEVRALLMQALQVQPEAAQLQQHEESGELQATAGTNEIIMFLY